MLSLYSRVGAFRSLETFSGRIPQLLEIGFYTIASNTGLGDCLLVKGLSLAPELITQYINWNTVGILDASLRILLRQKTTAWSGLCSV